jgi:hypothetical protein
MSGVGSTSCGTNSSHTNCDVTSEEGSNAELLRTGLDEATLTLLNGKLRVKCDFVFFEFDCVYDLTGAEFEVGGGHFIANETPFTDESGGICPNEMKFDALLGSLGRNSFFVLG